MKEKVCAIYVRMIREDAGARLYTYETAFFRAEYLQHVKREADRDLIKERLIGECSRVRDPEALRNVLRGIDKWLSPKELERFVQACVQRILSFKAPEAAWPLEALLVDLHEKGDADRRKQILAGIDAQIEKWKHDDAKAKVLQSLREYVETGFPF